MIISSYNPQKNKHQLTPALRGHIWPWDWLPCSQGSGPSLRATVMLATLTMIQRMRQQHWDGRVNKPGSLGRREDSGYQWCYNVAVKGLPRAVYSAHPLTGTTACLAKGGGLACLQMQTLTVHFTNNYWLNTHEMTLIDMGKQLKLSV